MKRKSGYLVNFPVERLRAASVVLHDSNGQPVPISSQVLRADQATEYVGWDGIVWMENLSGDNPIHVVTPDGRACDTTLTIAGGQPKALETYGPLTCALPPAPAGSAANNSQSGISP